MSCNSAIVAARYEIVGLSSVGGVGVPTTQTRHSNRQLVERIANGDEGALRALYQRFASTVYAVAYRILQDRADTDEVAAETFAQAWREAERFRSTRGSVAAWLTMMARSRAIDAVRARRRRDEISDRASQLGGQTAPGMGAEAEHTDRRVEANEQRVYVHRALSELSDDQRRVIELAFFGGRSHSEIASELDLPIGTVKTRIRSGMQQLRDKLRHVFSEAADD